jgi:predicted nucleotidyltransferase
LFRVGVRVQKEVIEALKRVFEDDKKVLAAYLFGSKARGTDVESSDYDIAVLLSSTPENLLDYYLHLLNRLSEILGDRVDLIILNNAPPLLKHQVIKWGRPIYIRSERSRILFEASAQCEYLDFKKAMERYDECLIKQILG